LVENYLPAAGIIQRGNEEGPSRTEDRLLMVSVDSRGRGREAVASILPDTGKTAMGSFQEKGQKESTNYEAI